MPRSVSSTDLDAVAPHALVGAIPLLGFPGSLGLPVLTGPSTRFRVVWEEEGLIPLGQERQGAGDLVHGGA